MNEIQIGQEVRQGDLLIRRIDSAPSDLKTFTKKDKIVLSGEISGHDHELESGLVMVVTGKENQINSNNRDTDGEPYAILDLKEDTHLVHPEHNTLDLTKGVYEVVRQREVKGVVID